MYDTQVGNNRGEWKGLNGERQSEKNTEKGGKRNDV